MQSNRDLHFAIDLETKTRLVSAIKKFIDRGTIHKNQADKLLDEVEQSTNIQSIRDMVRYLIKKNKTTYITNSFFDEAANSDKMDLELTITSTCFRSLLKHCRKILDNHQALLDQVGMLENQDCQVCNFM